MGRLIILGLLLFLAVSFIAICVGMYIYMKRTVKNGQTLMEETVNKQTRESKLSIKEILIYLSMIIVAVLFSLYLMRKLGHGFAPLASAIVTPFVLAFFNARRRTGRSVFIFTVTAVLALFLFFVYIFIDIPPTVPNITINNTKITLAKTKASDVLKDGFDIYVNQKDNYYIRYQDLLTSGKLKKYEISQNILVKKGFRRYYMSDCLYYLAKGNTIIGSIGLYGDLIKDTLLKDCRIVHFYLDQDCVQVLKRNSISFQLNGVNLLDTLNIEVLRKTFGKKLWSVPNNPQDITQLYYGIKWTSHSSHLFWNEYYSYIHFDENNNMTSFEMMSEIARDRKE